MLELVRRALAHPLTRRAAINAPSTTALRRAIVQDKRFLRRLYYDWYRTIAEAVPSGEGEVLEIGSGAGFMATVIPGLVTSEVLSIPGVSLVLDATRIPLRTGSLRAVVMTDVFHHIPSPRSLLAEVARCLRPGGAVIMIEPWVSKWSRFVYRHLHHEPFDPIAPRWEFPSSGPLSGANGALPWIVFERDRAVFEREFRLLCITTIRPFMPLSYVLSGGVSLRSLMPGWLYPACRSFDRLLERWPAQTAMFALIVLTRLPDARGLPSTRPQIIEKC